MQYRRISLLSVPSKVCEKLLLARRTPLISNVKLISDHQFGFHHEYSTIEQVRRVELAYYTKSSPNYRINAMKLSDRHFLVRHQSPLHPINAGDPQSSVLRPVLNLLYTAYLSTTNSILIAIFADYTALLASHNNTK